MFSATNVDDVAEVKRILIVDDEPKIIDVLEQYLVDDGFVVSQAYDGAGAVETFRAERPSLVILDLKMPGMSGLEAFRQMRAESDVPIIMLTSRSDEVDRVLGLELGADDYITKPFSPREVVARVKTVLRRVAQANGNNGRARPSGLIVVGGLQIDPMEHEVRVEGHNVALTPTEFRILEVLAQHPGRTFTRAQLLDRAKAENLDVFDRTLDRHIANLRHKIETEPANPRYIVTVFGVGYKMAKTQDREPGP